MTVARLTAIRGYTPPRGVEALVLRLGMALVAWANHRARRRTALRPDDPRRRAGEHRTRLEAQRESALAHASIVRMF
ncbi:MAG: hypothetical protein HY996_08585 [Micrococcales bacterium]|nr:hypothetical protein [Micrococcales bacterium]